MRWSWSQDTPPLGTCTSGQSCSQDSSSAVAIWTRLAANMDLLRAGVGGTGHPCTYLGFGTPGEAPFRQEVRGGSRAGLGPGENPSHRQTFCINSHSSTQPGETRLNSPACLSPVTREGPSGQGREAPMGTWKSQGASVGGGETEGWEPPGTTLRSFPHHCRRGPTQADSGAH